MHAHKALPVVASLLLPAAGAFAQDPPRIAQGSISIALETITTVAGPPIDLTFAPDGTDRLFIAGQSGQVRIFQGGGLLPTPFLTAPVTTGGERGLLGFAFHPAFAQPGSAGQGKLYTYTSEPRVGIPDFTHPELGTTGGDHHGVIREWTVSASDPNRVDTSIPSRVLMRIVQPQSNHNGGSLRFGPDNNLYLALGDGGGGNDNQGGINSNSDGHTNGIGNAQDLSNIYGTVLRFDPLGSNSANGQYGIPADNPFVGTPTALDEIFAYGLRNPFRMSFDRDEGTLYLGDVGQGQREEVNIITSGNNYGWVYMEGTRVNRAGGTGPFEPPIGEYLNRGAPGGGDGNAVIGGFLYRGSDVPELFGKYVFGDLAGTGNTGRLFYMEAEGGIIREFQYFPGFAPSAQLYSFGEDAAGELYALFANGLVRRITSFQWSVDGGGSWALAPNWTGTVPDAIGAVANFLGALQTPANAPAVITLDGDRTVGTLFFNSTVTSPESDSSYIIRPGSGGVLTINNGASPATIGVRAGMHAIEAPVSIVGATNIDIEADSALIMAEPVSVSGPRIINKRGAGRITFGGGLTLDFGSILTVQEGLLEAQSLSRGITVVNPGGSLRGGDLDQQGLFILGEGELGRIMTDVSVTVGNDAAPAMLSAQRIRTGTLTIRNNAMVMMQPDGGDDAVSIVTGLTVAAMGTLDLNDNSLIVRSSAATAAADLDRISDLIAAARNGGAWDGPGITSTAAREDPESLTGLAVIRNSDDATTPIFSEFAGQAVDENAILVMFTWNGDIDLNRLVDIDDYFLIDTGFLDFQAGMIEMPTYRQGDLDFNNLVDIDDYFLIDTAFLGQTEMLPGQAAAGAVAVPEPGLLGILAMGALAGCRRRRK